MTFYRKYEVDEKDVLDFAKIQLIDVFSDALPDAISDYLYDHELYFYDSDRTFADEIEEKLHDYVMSEIKTALGFVEKRKN